MRERGESGERGKGDEKNVAEDGKTEGEGEDEETRGEMDVEEE